ncbi:phage holin family protein [bacterium]|nr:phage holin family protein [bacterium]
MFLMKWLVMTIAVLAASYVVPGIEVTGFGVALVAALLLGLVNIFIRPLLVILTLPATIMTLGLFLLIINALLLTFVAWLVSGFAVAGFWSALIGSIFISIVSTLTSSLLKK